MRRFRYRFQPAASIIYDAKAPVVPEGNPVDSDRARKVLAFLADEGLVRTSQVIEPRPVSMANLRRVHTDDYLDSVTDPGTLEGIFGAPIDPQHIEDTLDMHRRMTGGTIQATRLALRTGRPAVNLGGGFHHASPDRGLGFCVYNDIAVAIRRLRARGFDAPVLVVDLDLHDGNGTRVVFADDPSVYTFSIHNTTWDDRPAIASTALAMGTAVEDETYLGALREVLPPVLIEQAPELVMYVAGTDVAADDTMGDWKITSDGMLARDRFVIEAVRNLAPGAAVAIVLGGGYGPKAWRYSARFLSWLMTGHALEPAEAAFHAMPRLAAMLRDPELTRTSAASDDWSLTADDLPGMTVASADNRVLGHFSPYGMELILDRTGILSELRARGFTSPVVSVSAEAGQAPTVRVYGDEAWSQLLIEFRVVRNHRLIPGLELLFVEWLLLQDPTATFSAERPRLPGQEHPGLGLLGQVAGLLVAMTDALGLAGVAFLPSNYYIAALSRQHLRFVDPTDQARFEALLEVLGDLSLAEASTALAEGRVIDSASGAPVRWEPAPMVVPRGEAIARRVEAPSYREALAEARLRWQFVLQPPSGDPPNA
jgi:acetoin utilization deacetylase AcuC-like enzyme